MPPPLLDDGMDADDGGAGALEARVLSKVVILRYVALILL